jgi:two-component system, cell cycle sensor histidine kinase and response regulator CckA
MERQATVFFVDDNRKSRELLTSMLEARGFVVRAEEDPQQALERARGEEFDVALLDYQMPGMLGTELARELKRMNGGVPVVVISGLAALPSDDLAFVNVHLGRGTRVEQLMETIEMLANPEVQAVGTLQWHEST